MQRQTPKHGDAAPSSATRLARARVAPVIDPAPPLPPAAIDVEQRDDGLARALAVSVVQRKTATVPTLVDTAKASLKASIGGNTAKECKTRLAKRFPKGPLFTAANLADIQALGTADEGRKWLKEVGIGTEADALQYLHDADYKQWLKVSPGKRLLIATIAVRDGIGANDENPPPSYTLGRAMSIQTGGLTGPLNAGAKAQAEAERDEQIRDAFVNTLMPVGANELANLNQAWIDQQAVLAANAQAQQILARILLILQVGLQVYDPTVGAHVDYKTGDVVRALAHGGRVNIRIPALSGTNVNDDAYALTDWIGITANHGATGSVKDRGFGTHHMAIGPNTNGPGTGSFVEEGGKGASMANKRSKGVKLFGLDLAAGGLGKRDFNGDVILPDGGHGHMFIGFTKPTDAPRRCAADRHRDDRPGRRQPRRLQAQLELDGGHREPRVQPLRPQDAEDRRRVARDQPAARRPQQGAARRRSEVDRSAHADGQRPRLRPRERRRQRARPAGVPGRAPLVGSAARGAAPDGAAPDEPPRQIESLIREMMMRC